MKFVFDSSSLTSATWSCTRALTVDDTRHAAIQFHCCLRGADQLKYSCSWAASRFTTSSADSNKDSDTLNHFYFPFFADLYESKSAVTRVCWSTVVKSNDAHKQWLFSLFYQNVGSLGSGRHTCPL